MSDLKSYQLNPVVSYRVEGAEGAILFNPDRDDAVVINPTGCHLWAQLAVPRTSADLAAHLVETYSDVTLEQAAQDVDAFLQQLLGDFVQEV
jgi:hypothetical protein